MHGSAIDAKHMQGVAMGPFGPPDPSPSGLPPRRVAAAVPPAAPASRLRVLSPGEHSPGLGTWEVFQHPRFAEIHARHFGCEVVDHHGVLVYARRVPGLGLMRTQVYTPEAVAGANWHRILADLPTGRMDVLTNSPAPPGSMAAPASAPDLHSFVVDLRQGADRLYASFEPGVRKAIRRAERAGMTVRRGDEVRDLGRFHEVLMRVTRGGVVYGAPAAGMLHDLMRAGFGRLYVAEIGRDLVGGSFQLANRNSQGFVSVFDRHACDGLPGQLLYWGVMQGEMDAGMPFYDMGAQSLASQPGLTTAKSAFSPVLVPAYRYELTRSRWRATIYDAWRWMKRPKEQGPPGPTKAAGVTG